MRKKLYLLPGHYVASSEATAVTTILGSCVAVCLWDRGRAMGAVNHYLLPHWTGPREVSPRFGPVAIELAIDGLRALGSLLSDLEAKVFGGAWILSDIREEDHVGARNVAVARRLLAEKDIPVVAEDVGGNRGRKLIYHTDTGIALVKKL